MHGARESDIIEDQLAKPTGLPKCRLTGYFRTLDPATYKGLKRGARLEDDYLEPLHQSLSSLIVWYTRKAGVSRLFTLLHCYIVTLLHWLNLQPVGCSVSKAEKKPRQNKTSGRRTQETKIEI